jgi:predicted GIY-YIG superfamily endonuclease
MTSDELGYTENPQNGSGIKRLKTTRLIRAWEMNRSLESLHALDVVDMGGLDFPGVYILFEGNNKVYIGEAKSLVKRIDNHNRMPEEKIKNWDKVMVINDGRPATQSDLNDEVVRKAIEYYLIELFKTNKYRVVAQGENQNLNPTEMHLVDSLKKELLFFFQKTTLISKDIERKDEKEVFSDEVKTILIKRKMVINKWKEKDAEIDGVITFVRQGSKKNKGYQITIRGRKPGSFIDCVKKKTGNLLVRRDGVLLIPLSMIHDVINDDSALEQDTVDIYIVFKDDGAFLSYKTNTIDVTKYKLSK